VKITIESTTKIVTVVQNGCEVQSRIWEGVTESGIPVHCYIARIAAPIAADLRQFDAELQACRHLANTRARSAACRQTTSGGFSVNRMSTRTL
jgi:hypothetical protein